ncbi:MAG: RnfABCDGE type electron transport complex subunit G [Pseudomonadales bacterium]|nr:RnfABCDGE type electron transport complex subunit G [Pseudomonadales bacterium]
MSGVIFRLTALAFICALALGLMHLKTKPCILANKKAYALKQLQSVIPDRSVEFIAIGDAVFEIREEQVLIGYLKEITTEAGYNGEIKLWLAVSLDNKVMGARVTQHNETPGLGDDLDIAVSDWILSFNDQKLETIRWAVKKDKGDFDQFTGATITPRAVVAVIEKALSANVNKDVGREVKNGI